MGLNWGLILIMTIISLLKGGDASLIEAAKCDTTDWILFTVLLIICFIFLAIGIVINKREYNDKIKAGYKFVPGDFEATPKNITSLSSISFVAAFAAAFSGAGAGAVFSPILLLIGMQAQVATATAMYLTMFITLAASI